MHLSALRCSTLKFFKHRNFIFTDKKFAKKAFFKLYVSLMAGLIPAVYWIYEFATPTPDIVYDLKRWLHPEFEAYVVSKGLATYDPLHNAAVRNFHYKHKFISAQRRYDNVRVRDAEITKRLCYECGDVIVGGDKEYQEHILWHEATFLVYQLYHFESSSTSEDVQEKRNLPAQNEDPKSS
uniref:Uncharacterized protein n=1 Tax=Ditylenchus dipsaci TaxID=166011 RepID=A0A915EA68_9BILA